MSGLWQSVATENFNKGFSICEAKYEKKYAEVERKYVEAEKKCATAEKKYAAEREKTARYIAELEAQLAALRG